MMLNEVRTAHCYMAAASTSASGATLPSDSRSANDCFRVVSGSPLARSRPSAVRREPAIRQAALERMKTHRSRLRRRNQDRVRSRENRAAEVC